MCIYLFIGSFIYFLKFEYLLCCMFIYLFIYLFIQYFCLYICLFFEKLLYLFKIHVNVLVVCYFLHISPYISIYLHVSPCTSMYPRTYMFIIYRYTYTYTYTLHYITSHRFTSKDITFHSVAFCSKPLRYFTLVRYIRFRYVA